MSVTPASAKTSASPSFAQQIPAAPAAICIRAMTGDLCVLQCGRSCLPLSLTIFCIRAMLRASFEDSTRTAGVGISDKRMGMWKCGNVEMWESNHISTSPHSHIPTLPDEPQRLRSREPREDRPRVVHAKMASNDLVEDAAEVRRHGEVAPVVALFAGQTGPFAVHLAAADALPADDEHGVAVAVIGAAVAVLGDRPPELAHRQDDDVLHPIAEVARERGDALAEVGEPLRELADRRS